MRALPGIFVAAVAVLAVTGCSRTASGARTGLDRIDHILVIYAENRSFDHLYGLFPGADGIQELAPAQYLQVDRDGTPLPELPPAWKGKGIHPAFPHRMPNRPFRLDAPPLDLPPNQRVHSGVHRFYQNVEQIDGGRNDRFAAASDAGGFVMGYYDGSSMAMWRLAREFTLADAFFMGSYGGSFLNHQWLICACTPRDENVPASERAQLDARGWLKRRPDSPPSALAGDMLTFDGEFSPDGYAVNSAQPPYQPSRVLPVAGGDLRLAGPSLPRLPVLPPQTATTIGDTLSAKGVSWAWYAGGWNAAVKDGAQPPAVPRTVIGTGAINFLPHHHPFNYYARFAPGTADRERHLKDYADLVAGIERGDLPAVAFYKPASSLDQHPGYTDVDSGDRHVADVVARVRASPLWASTAIIVTYDENGGFWDHAPPPPGDRWGPGSRVPTIVISPFAKRGHVDHTPYDTTSILKFITRRFGLEPLPGVRPGAGDLTAAFDFGGR